MDHTLNNLHRSMVAALTKPGENILKELTPAQCNMLHMVIGISGEAGELIDAIKKHVIYRKELDRDNIIEELGDLEFYMEGLRQELRIDRDETLEVNYKKLKGERYKDGYSDKAAIERIDKV